MDYNHMHVVAKKIASILAENEATVEDLAEIFKTVKGHLVVGVKNSQRFVFGGIHLPNQACDDDGIGD